MRTFTLTFLLFYCTGVLGQTLINPQYASSVIAFSSEYSAEYAATWILGAPTQFPNCGNANNSWTPLAQDGPPEFITVGFTTPQPVNNIKIYQTLSPGAVSSVEVRNAVGGTWTTVYTATPASIGPCSQLLEINISTTAFNVDALRINVDNNIPGWHYFDAVSIANYSQMNYQWDQFVGHVIAFSSQYGSVPNNWSAQETVGNPNTASCGDISTAWAPSSQDGSGGNTREYLELGYTFPAHVNRVRIYETSAPGFVDTVYLRDAATGTWHMIYSATAAPATPCPNILELNFTETTYNVDAIRIAMDIAVPGWNEIDAVSVRTNLPGGARFTTQNGNWSDPATWSGGAVPGSGDTVVIGHSIILDVNAGVKSVLINNGATLNIPANTLNLGPSGGGKEIIQVQGTLNVTGGTLVVNGYMDFQTSSTFNMTGGEVVVDGNNGTSAGSVPDGIHLIKLVPGMNVSVTGGMITVVDPQFHSTGQAITGGYAFGSSSIFRLGNGISTQGGSNTYGFGGPLPYPQFRDFVMDGVTGAGNRQFNPYENFNVTGNLTVTSGTFSPSWNANITGDVLNNGNIVNLGTFRTQGNLVNNSTISMNTGSFSVARDFTNNTGASYTVPSGSSYTSVGEDLLNNGTFNTSSWLYMSYQFTPSSWQQSIGGSGTYSMLGLDIINSNPAGVTLLVPLTATYLYFEPSPGKLFLGNNDLRLLEYSYGTPGSDRYVVLNGTGKLIINGVFTTPEIFPVGTTASYTPVTISNGSGHDFAVYVRSTFTAPPPSAGVNREWDISDLTGGAVSATLTFQWNGSDEDPAFTRANCHVSHYTGGTWTAVSPAGAASGSDPYMRTVTGISSFSPFSVLSGGTPLPVHLVQFDALKENNRVNLKWMVEEESNMAHYDVERSADGHSFDKIGTVAAINTIASHSYSLQDVRPMPGINYYRLKQIELDGSFTYSSVAKVDMKSKYTVHLYPNPVRDFLTIQGIQQFDRATLLDAQGRTVKVWNITGTAPLDLSRIGTGIYTLRLEASDEIKLEKIIIAR